MIPAGTTVTCPSCDGEFEIEYDMLDGEVIECDNCDTELFLVNGDLKTAEEEEDIYEDDDDEEDDVEENPQYLIGKKPPEENE